MIDSTGEEDYTNMSVNDLNNINGPRAMSSSSEYFNNVQGDDYDSEGKDSSHSYKERRREAHTQAEQKRRDSIKKGYNNLQSIVPTCSQTNSTTGTKLSKAAILNMTIDHINLLTIQKEMDEKERDKLQKHVAGLVHVQTSYERLVKGQDKPSSPVEPRISDDIKFRVFQLIMEELYSSFRNVNMSSFEELSVGVTSWLEEYGKPQALNETISKALTRIHNNNR